MKTYINVLRFLWFLFLITSGCVYWFQPDDWRVLFWKLQTASVAALGLSYREECRSLKRNKGLKELGDVE